MSAASIGGRSDLAGLKFLIVEDKYLIADELSRIVTAHGGNVAALTGAVAVAKAAVGAGDVDMALLDIDLAGQDVLEVVADLEARSVPFLFVTGFDPDQLADAYRAHPVVTKPFTSARILDAVRRRLGETASPG